MENYDSINWEDSNAVENKLRLSCITFNVAYVGYIEITKSVASLDRDLRMAMAKECIMRMNEKINGKRVGGRKSHKKIQEFINDQPTADYSGSRVLLSVSLGCIEMKLMMHDLVLARHSIHNISYAFYDEHADLSSYIGYLGKDALEFRAFYILDCGPIRAMRIDKALKSLFQMKLRDLRKITTYRRVAPAAVKTPLNTRVETETKVSDCTSLQLQNETWFHGAISNESAKSLLKNAGDFLVHESTTEPGQFILSCFNGEHKHIALIAADGKIRMRNKEFASIHEFIEFHSITNTSIVTCDESELFLLQPIVSESSL